MKTMHGNFNFTTNSPQFNLIESSIFSRKLVFTQSMIFAESFSANYESFLGHKTRILNVSQSSYESIHLHAVVENHNIYCRRTMLGKILMYDDKLEII